MRIGSLFSGYGGLDLAALQLFPGSSVAWHCEWEKAPSRILDHHWPGVPNLHDITTVDFGADPRVDGSIEPVDILTGGYPCQPFSAAGRRKGTTDERHLWPYVRAAIRYLRPRYTLLENVAGHRSLGFDRVLGDMAEDGMHVRWTSVRASDVGACHRRERLFILITPADADYPTGHGERSRSQPRQGSGNAADSDRNAVRLESVAEFRCSGSPKLGRDRSHAADAPSSRRTRLDDRPSGEEARRGREWVASGSAGGAPPPVNLLPTPTSRDHKGAANAPGRTRGGRPRTVGDDTLPDTVQRLLPTPAASDATGGGANPEARAAGGHSVQLIDAALTTAWGPYEAAIARQELFSRPAPAPTEANSKGNPRLAAQFAEWMMFLPAGHVTDPAIGLSRNDQLKAIGNGVCPPQAVAAYRQLLEMRAVVA